MQNLDSSKVESIFEILKYLEENNKESYQEILNLLDDNQELENISNLINEEVKFFSIIAFEKFNDKEYEEQLKNIVKNIKLIVEKNNKLKIIHQAYIDEIDLIDINSNLNKEKSNKLKNFLMKFFDEIEL